MMQIRNSKAVDEFLSRLFAFYCQEVGKSTENAKNLSEQSKASSRTACLSNESEQWKMK